MILSFHPCFNGDKNIICAGRAPTEDDLNLIRSADAVILPQGCNESLYKLAKKNCKSVFPNYDARFKYPGKIGQIELFNKMEAPFPETRIFKNTKAFFRHSKSNDRLFSNFPVVFKFDWGGEGEFVYLIESFEHLKDIIGLAKNYERSGQKGFLMQQQIVNQERTLRVVVIHNRMISYWRVQKEKGFYSNVSKGASIDAHSDPELMLKAKNKVWEFCKKTKINLAGFDIIFSNESKYAEPLFLEINYFFGRKGLGGSKKYYAMLNREIITWINGPIYNRNRRNTYKKRTP